MAKADDSTIEENIHELSKPFPAKDVLWRIEQSGVSKSSGNPWAKVLAYIDNRAIVDRLDEIIGATNWSNDFKQGPSGGVLCCIAIRVGKEWIAKWDGAENTQYQPVKSGLSAAMKRSASQWGIGRYLYNLEDGWANIHAGGKNRSTIKYKDGSGQEQTMQIQWDPPSLPAWALPEGEAPKVKTPERPQLDPTDMKIGEQWKRVGWIGAKASEALADLQKSMEVDRLGELSSDKKLEYLEGLITRVDAILAQEEQTDTASAAVSSS